MVRKGHRMETILGKLREMGGPVCGTFVLSDRFATSSPVKRGSTTLKPRLRDRRRR